MSQKLHDAVPPRKFGYWPGVPRRGGWKSRDLAHGYVYASRRTRFLLHRRFGSCVLLACRVTALGCALSARVLAL
jgi:hypothetical protein